MSTAIAIPTPATPGRVGQATAIEQQRAAAEVYAAVMVAQQMPRSENRAMAAMRSACDRRELAERAFFRYSRAGTAITGPSIQLARELARCWGNISYQVAELRRDDDRRESEMMAWAWDLETNARSSTVFVVPHVRDTKAGRKPIEDVRDVYENNANQGARRLRECIFAVLPGWFVQEAQDRCAATLTRDGGSGKTIEQRRADAVAAFAKLNVVESQLEDKLGRPSRDWTDIDLANLGVVHRALSRGETTRDEEFPVARLTTADLAGDAAATASPATVHSGSSPLERLSGQPVDDREQRPDEALPSAHEELVDDAERAKPRRGRPATPPGNATLASLADWPKAARPADAAPETGE